MSNEQEANERATNTPLDNLLKAAKAVARHEQAHRQCVRTEHREILIQVGELFDLSDAVAAMEAAPAGAPALGEIVIAGRTLAEWQEFARRDDCLDRMVPSDLRQLVGSVLRSHAQAPASGEVEDDATNRMWRISKLIANMQATLDRFGDTCVYIRRGGLSWGAVALNREADDEKYGVFDLQAQHDRDMEQRVGQVERLMEDRDEWRERATKAEAALPPSQPASGGSGTKGR